MPYIKRIALPDSFCRNYGTQDDLFERYGLSPKHIARIVAETIGKLSA